ncbi:MAG: HepT-like ribonuclease domain-containing protein [Caulobacteraceae bacterium]
MRSLEVIGEAAGKVSPATRAKLGDVAWNEIVGMRNRLIHDYANVELALVWEAVSDRLEPLINQLAPLVGDEMTG